MPDNEKPASYGFRLTEPGIVETSDGSVGVTGLPYRPGRRLVALNGDGTYVEARCDGCRHWHTEDNPISRHRAPRGECYGMAEYHEERGRAVEGEVFDMWTMPDWGCAEFAPKEAP